MRGEVAAAVHRGTLYQLRRPPATAAEAIDAVYRIHVVLRLRSKSMLKQIALPRTAQKRLGAAKLLPQPSAGGLHFP